MSDRYVEGYVASCVSKSPVGLNGTRSKAVHEVSRVDRSAHAGRNGPSDSEQGGEKLVIHGLRLALIKGRKSESCYRCTTSSYH
jgi:hypothetical protein